MNDIPFVAIGNNELGEPMNEGDMIDCPHCQGRHPIECGTSEGKKTNLAMFYNCGDKTYLAGVQGRNVMHKFLK